MVTLPVQLRLQIETPGRAGSATTVVGDATSPTPKVLGLDLSLSCTGVAGPGWTDTIGTRPRGRREDRREHTHERLHTIRTTIADRYLTGVDLAVIEDAAYGSPDAGHQLAGLRWQVRHLLWTHRIPYALVPPTSLKMFAADNGNASKGQMVAAVRVWFPWFDGGADEADAAALMALGRRWLGAPVCPDPPRLGEVLAGCDWPALAGVTA